mmetsp:Transcript_62222/g.110582  ORF Transcript_62222/g.110582 Transcript_62222/m.110582 type:complete len:237 (-) Transcript_62222:559-1269(-)
MGGVASRVSCTGGVAARRGIGSASAAGGVCGGVLALCGIGDVVLAPAASSSTGGGVTTREGAGDGCAFAFPRRRFGFAMSSASKGAPPRLLAATLVSPSAVVPASALCCSPGLGLGERAGLEAADPPPPPSMSASGSSSSPVDDGCANFRRPPRRPIVDSVSSPPKEVAPMVVSAPPKDSPTVLAGSPLPKPERSGAPPSISEAPCAKRSDAAPGLTSPPNGGRLPALDGRRGDTS